MPPQNAYYLGLDVGTTSVKACAFTAAGEMVIETIEAYPLLQPEPGAAIQRPTQILASCGLALKKTVAEADQPIASIGLSCPMHSVLLYDAETGFDDTIYTWADGRGQAVMDRITPEERTELLRETGTPVHPMSPLVKALWLRETHAAAFVEKNGGRKPFLYSLKELLTLSWTGRALLDEQLASATGLYDAVERKWSCRALQAVMGWDELCSAEAFFYRLPPVKPATHRLEWLPEVAAELGTTGVPLFLGGSDGCLANLGSGINKPGEVAVTIGTSAAVRATHQSGRIDPKHQLFNYRMDAENFAVGGASNNGGKVIEYWQSLLSGHFTSVGDFIAAAFTVDPNNCPTYAPFLNGERAPLWDATASSELRGLGGHHEPAHIARAVLEGVTDNVVAILRNLEAAVGETRVIHASGGFTRSGEWVALLERKSGRRVEVADTPQASAFGAALVGRLGLGG